LYRALAGLGVPAIEGKWAGRWIMQNVQRGDLVHVHWPSFLYFRPDDAPATLYNLLRSYALTTIVRLRGARIVWTAHNLYPHDGGRNEWSHRIARQYVSRIAHTILVHGPTAARIVSAEFGIEAGRIRLVPHGNWRSLHPNLPDRHEARRRAGLPDGVVLYGFVGSCRPYKNIESIIAALPLLDDGSHLLIAGEFSSPEYLAAIRSMISSQFADRVHIVPRFLADEEIMTFVAALDALVLSYKEILTSGAAMLAISAGVPVVAPRIGGMPDVVDDRCGVLYDPKAPDGLLQAMREVRRRSYCATEIIAHALSYDWKVSANVLVELLDAQPPPA
jgi:glycosyltransferase involved in cell wall biosynthesis